MAALLIREWWKPRALIVGLLYKFMPKLALWHLETATALARRKLTKSGPLRILIDNSVLSNGVTHETLWVQTANGGHMARVPVHGPGSEHKEYGDLAYLTGLTHLARQGHIELCTSAELKAEQSFHRPEVFRDVGWFDRNLFSGLSIASVDGSHWHWFGPTIAGLGGATPSDPREEQRRRLEDSEDALFRALVTALGRKNDQDAWHLRTAERHGCMCFLTMDYRLIKNFDAQRGNKAIRKLATQPMTPTQLGKALGVRPVKPEVLSFNEASWFVHLGISMPGNRRRVHLPPEA